VLPALGLVIGVVSIFCLLAGLISGVIALCGIPSYGTKGILWPALLGLGLNSLGIAAVVVLWILASSGSVPEPEDLDLHKQLAGTWVQTEPENRIELRLSGNGSFRFLMTGTSVADFSGTWSVQRRKLYLNVEQIRDGNRDHIEKHISWSIDELTGNQLVLGAKNGKDRYTRQPPGK
jgi:hypothetical protein